MRMRYSRHLNIGPTESPEASWILVKWCQVSQQWSTEVDFS